MRLYNVHRSSKCTDQGLDCVVWEPASLSGSFLSIAIQTAHRVGPGELTLSDCQLSRSHLVTLSDWQLSRSHLVTLLCFLCLCAPDMSHITTVSLPTILTHLGNDHSGLESYPNQVIYAISTAIVWELRILSNARLIRYKVHQPPAPNDTHSPHRPHHILFEPPPRLLRPHYPAHDRSRSSSLQSSAGRATKAGLWVYDTTRLDVVHACVSNR